MRNSFVLSVVTEHAKSGDILSILLVGKSTINRANTPATVDKIKSISSFPLYMIRKIASKVIVIVKVLETLLK